MKKVLLSMFLILMVAVGVQPQNSMSIQRTEKAINNSNSVLICPSFNVSAVSRTPRKDPA